VFGVDSARSGLGWCFGAAAPILGGWAAVRGVPREAGVQGGIADCPLG